MRWPVFAILAYLMLVLQEGLRTLWSIQGTSPSLLLILLVYVGLWAPPMTAAWAALALGLLIDLTTPVKTLNHLQDVTLIGPACLGYLAGAYVTVRGGPECPVFSSEDSPGSLDRPRSTRCRTARDSLPPSRRAEAHRH